jgi:hypothetical protein
MNPVEFWIPLAGMVTGVLCIGAIAFAATRIFAGPVGQALARRVGARGGAQPDGELLNELASLRSDLEHVQHRLMETEERLDFTERLLARHQEPSRIAGGAQDGR